jgi:hypothetical protein
MRLTPAKEDGVSAGLRAGLEVREAMRAPLPPRSEPARAWDAAAPAVDIDRVENRLLFALLAGQPTILGIGALLPSRGLPEDVSQEVRDQHDSWHGLAFDASWVTLDELVSVTEQLTATLKGLASAQGQPAEAFLSLHRSVTIDAVIAFLAVYQAHGCDTRMVFWSTPI